MRLIVNSFGSTGDFEPFLALAKELTDHGHDALLALPPQMASRAANFGVAFAPVGPTDVLGGVREMLVSEISEKKPNSQKLNTYFSLTNMAKMFADLQQICNGADGLICSAESPLGRMIHELTNIPYISVHLTYFNEQFAEAGLDFVTSLETRLASYINPFRRQLGLQPLYNLLSTDGISEQLALFATSRLMLDASQESYWPDHYHVTGFYFLEQYGNWQPDPDLVNFLEAGPPPVVFTFGSMVHDNSEQLLEILLESVAQIGCRAIFIRGWNEVIATDMLPDNIYMAQFIPYHWLFPKAHCVVQSGGAGTIAWALRAGVPILCLPHVFEQFSFAQFVEFSGCGITFPFHMLTKERMVTAVSKLLNHDHYHQAAQNASKVIQSESGVVTARQKIEQWYKNTQPHKR